MKLAPILLFTYKRLDTLKLTVQALSENYLASKSQLYIFSDGPKKSEDSLIINEIRAYIRTVDGFESVKIFESEINKGLATSIINGVNQVMLENDRVIVLEDDLKTTPNFLNFMNESLEKYESMSKVFSISGYSFNLGAEKNSETDTYFLNRGWSWGWATWKDRWTGVDWGVEQYHLFSQDKAAMKRFSHGGSDLNQMLWKQMNGKLDSWAIRWFFHQFLTQTLTLYPITSKVDNNGFDENATHTTGSSKRYLPLMDEVYKTNFKFPSNIAITPFYQKRFLMKMGILARITSKMESFLKKIFS